MQLNEEQKQEIMELVAMQFETGHRVIEEKKDLRDCSTLSPKALNAAWEYYNELVNLGPAGFYEEFKDVYDFDPMFAEEYGDNESLEI